jgi:transglutaminase-like putative cysteine protease
VLLVATVSVSAWSVREAGWVETPGLIAIVMLSCVAGLVVAKARGPWPLWHLLGLGLGLVVIVWQASSVVDGQPPLPDRVREVWNRLSDWYDAAVSGGISTDLLPFTMILLTAGWLLGYISSWFLFRRSNVWIGLILAGLALMTNLSYLPVGYESRFFLFVLFAMLLIARVTMAQRQSKWREASIGFSPRGGWVGIRVPIGLTAVVLVVAAVLPLSVYVSRAAANMWDVGRTPVERVENHFGRLFSGIKSQKDLAGRFFGDTLPFQGKISFEGEIVISAASEHPSYWLSRTYSHYTSEGWIAGETNKRTAGPDVPLPPQESFGRDPVMQRVQPTFDTYNLLSGGNLRWISRDALVETLAPLQFTIDIQNVSGDGQLPGEIQGLARELRTKLRAPTTSFVQSEISRSLPPDLVLVSVTPAPGTDGTQRLPIERVTVARKEPSLPDVVSWKFVDKLVANQSYEMQSLVPNASEVDLGTSGTEYSGFLEDHYLQLPASLPERVRDLAKYLTEDAETPLDKALAIQDYLRGPTLEYSQDINKPPVNVDGVDYFLFQTEEGYSDYFSSAMTVMLRSLGVPARLAAGYAPGDVQDVNGLRSVRDSDSHLWTQVYFPGHGWIDFEPTPKWPVTAFGAPAEPVPAPGAASLPESVGDESILGENEECEDIGEAECDALSELPDQNIDLASRLAGVRFPMIVIVVLAALAGVFGLWLVTWLAWTRGTAKAGPAESIYIKMNKLGTLAGLNRQVHQTPLEYARALGNAIPALAAGAQAVAWAFGADRYGRPDPENQGPGDLRDAWKRVRSGLLMRALRRLVPVGGA